jgi:SNF2 family DNA or RNA helicase
LYAERRPSSSTGSRTTFRFTIPLVRLDSAGIQRIRNNIPSGHNPFDYYDKTIISMDTLKGNNEYRNYLDKSRWDIIVIDECHNVAVRKGDSGSSLRARLAKNLATKSDTLILLSATPHDGSANSFASLIWLLDPTAISDPDDYTRADLDRKDLFVRRFKKDIKAQAEGQFPEPVTRRLSTQATPQEAGLYAHLSPSVFRAHWEAAGIRRGTSASCWEKANW